MPNDPTQNGAREVVVNANLTTQAPSAVSPADQAESEDAAEENQDLEGAFKRIEHLETELKSVNTEMDCKIHGEFDAIRRYVDRAIEHDRLKKRP